MKPSLFMWLSNWIPLSLLSTSIAVFFTPLSLTIHISISLSILYLLPPILCRLALLVKRPQGSCNLRSIDGYIWFFTFQLQIIYARLPFLEELLKFVPGLFNAWLWLWGSRVSLLTYWAPGTMLTDRWLLHIEPGVLVGPRCHIGGHILTTDSDGIAQLLIAPVHFECGCIIGAKAIVGPGASVAAKETLAGTMILKPFYRWENGQRVRPSEKNNTEAQTTE